MNQKKKSQYIPWKACIIGAGACFEMVAGSVSLSVSCCSESGNETHMVTRKWLLFQCLVNNNLSWFGYWNLSVVAAEFVFIFTKISDSISSKIIGLGPLKWFLIVAYVNKKQYFTFIYNIVDFYHWCIRIILDTIWYCSIQLRTHDRTCIYIYYNTKTWRF